MNKYKINKYINEYIYIFIKLVVSYASCDVSCCVYIRLWKHGCDVTTSYFIKEIENVHPMFI